MKTVIELLRKPLVKIIGLALVIYFGLFADKKNPDSLGNRLSSDRIKQNIDQAQEKGAFILSNIDKARQIGAGGTVEVVEPSQNFSTITVQDIEDGEGDEILKCGDEAEIAYDIHVAGSNGQLEFVPQEKLLIGSNANRLLERKIIGMKSGGERIINVPRDFKSANQKLSFLLKFNEAALQYNVRLLKFSASNSDKVNCSANNQ